MALRVNPTLFFVYVSCDVGGLLLKSAHPIIPASAQSVLFRIVDKGNALAGGLKKVCPEFLYGGVTAQVFVNIGEKLTV